MGTGLNPTLLDIAKMPDFNLDGPQNGVHSVSECLVYCGDTLPYDHPAPVSQLAVPTINCVAHGAMNCVAKMSHGVLWRCLTCNVGAYEARS